MFVSRRDSTFQSVSRRGPCNFNNYGNVVDGDHLMICARALYNVSTSHAWVSAVIMPLKTNWSRYAGLQLH